MAGTSEDVTVRIEKNVLSWFGHHERMSDERMAKNIYCGKVSGKRQGETSQKHEDPPKGMYEEVDDNGETVAFGARFPFTPIGIQREARLD